MAFPTSLINRRTSVGSSHQNAVLYQRGLISYPYAYIPASSGLYLISIHPLLFPFPPDNNMLFLLVWPLILLQPSLVSAAAPITVSIPVPSTEHAVASNFLGISFELSFMDQYCAFRPFELLQALTLITVGNDTSTIPAAMINFLAQIRSRTGANFPVRLRIGGNSADSSHYLPSQKSPMIALTDPNANANNQPVNYGPELWNVMQKVASDVGVN